MKTHQDKIDQAKELLYAQRMHSCALLCSFGKDSMVLLHLIREVLPPNRLNCGGYPIPIIYHRHPYFAFKNEFAERITRSWDLEVYDFPPAVCGVKCRVKDESHAARLELVARYPFGESYMDVPLNTEPPLARRPFVCGRQWMLRPKTAVATFPWNVAFHGHKSSDVDPYEGTVPLRFPEVEIGGVRMLFPLRDWTDQDVWDYIETNKVPTDRRRYSERQELADKWANPDYIHACTACIDPREKAESVLCPKIKEQVPNLGPVVTRLEVLPDYIEQGGR